VNWLCRPTDNAATCQAGATRLFTTTLRIRTRRQQTAKDECGQQGEEEKGEKGLEGFDKLSRKIG
jgi:hypothetical protein